MKRVVMVVSIMCAVLLAGASIQAQQGNKTSSPEDAAVYIVSPANGAVVPTTFTVIFGLTGMGVAPAGIVKQGTGHHHLLVDGVVMPDLDMPLGAVVTHFGGGQTQTILTLPPGEHTLQLILGDHMHIPHEPPVISQVISIIVAN